jgi:hypothetical protein
LQIEYCKLQIENQKLRRMKRTMLVFVAFILNTAVSAQEVVASKSGAPGTWQELGTITVKSELNHDDVVLAGFSEYRSIKLKAVDAPVQIVNMNVIWADGKVDHLDVKFDLPVGGESRVIDLKGGRHTKKIRRVTIWYKNDPQVPMGTAKVALFGMK